MTGEEFMELYRGNTELRQYIVDTAKRRSRRKELQEDYVQEAWLWVSMSPSGRTFENLKEIAYKAIYSEYWKERKQKQALDAYYYNLSIMLMGWRN